MKKWLYWLPVVVWMGVIFYSSSQPYQDQDIKPFLSGLVDLTFLIPVVDWISFTYHNSVVSVDEMGIYSFIEFFIRKGAHVTVFLILMLTFYYAYAKTWSNRTNVSLLVSFLLTAVYAAFDEWHQGITPNRTPYVGDVLLDCFGALLGVGLVLVFMRWRKALV